MIRDLNSQQIAKYSRHICLPNVGIQGQKKLTNSRILIVGLGGLGSPVALYLAAAGIGTLGLAEFDKVESHNLQRQILHKNTFLEKDKLLSAEKELSALNPEISLELHASGILPDNAVELISQYDLVIDGTDNFPTRYLINDAAYFAKKPLVYGSVYQFEGQVSFFNPCNGGPCYRCYFPKMPKAEEIPNCSEAGVIGALCGVVGSMQSMEAIKYILGIGECSEKSMILVDSLTMNFRKLYLEQDSHCPLCGDQPEITEIKKAHYTFNCQTKHETKQEYKMDLNPIEISVEESKKLLDSDPTTLLIDVREDHEREICSILPSIHIPMQSIPENLDKISKDQTLLVHCHHGMRSLNVVNYLREKGYKNAINMRGGIDQWTLQIDSSLTRY